MSTGDRKLDNDGYAITDGGGSRLLEGADPGSPCCNCTCNIECADVISKIPKMPCTIKVNLRGLCRCFCFPATGIDVYHAGETWRFQFCNSADWTTWIENACAVVSPTGNPCVYEGTFQKLIPMWAYVPATVARECDCPTGSVGGNPDYMGDQGCAETTEPFYEATSQIWPPTAGNAASAYMYVSVQVSFFDDGGTPSVGVTIRGNIAYPDVYPPPYPQLCASGLFAFGSTFLFYGTAPLPDNWTDGASNIIDTITVDNYYEFDGQEDPGGLTGQVVCGDSIVTILGIVPISNYGGTVTLTADCSADPAGVSECDPYVPNCCQNATEYAPCTGSDDQYTPDAWTVTGSGITMKDCWPTNTVSFPGVKAIDNTTATPVDLNTSFCVNFVDGTTAWQESVADSTFWVTAIQAYTTNTCSTTSGGLTTNPSAYIAKCRIWRDGGNWKIEVWSDGLIFSPSAAKAVWFRGVNSVDTCNDTIVFTNSISAATTDWQTDTNSDAGWNVSEAAFVASGGTLTITKCC